MTLMKLLNEDNANYHQTTMELFAKNSQLVGLYFVIDFLWAYIFSVLVPIHFFFYILGEYDKTSTNLPR